jgi:hypothetical protein
MREHRVGHRHAPANRQTRKGQPVASATRWETSRGAAVSKRDQPTPVSSTPCGAGPPTTFGCRRPQRSRGTGLPRGDPTTPGGKSLERRKPTRASACNPANPRAAGTARCKEQHPVGGFPKSTSHSQLESTTDHSTRTARSARNACRSTWGAMTHLGASPLHRHPGGRPGRGAGNRNAFTRARGDTCGGGLRTDANSIAWAVAPRASRVLASHGLPKGGLRCRYPTRPVFAGRRGRPSGPGSSRGCTVATGRRRQEGNGPREGRGLAAGSRLCRAQPQGRYRHETRPERTGTECKA